MKSMEFGGWLKIIRQEWGKVQDDFKVIDLGDWLNMLSLTKIQATETVKSLCGMFTFGN